MRPIRTGRASGAAPFESLGTLLSSHRGTTRVVLAALSFAIIIALSSQAPATKAGPEAPPLRTESLLPEQVGAGIGTADAVTLSFDAPMNPGSVEAALQVLPTQPIELGWNEDLDELSVRPAGQWRTDETYVVVVGSAAARTDGSTVEGPQRWAFTTRTAPRVTDFQVRFVPAHETPLKPEPETLEKAAAVLDADALEADAASSLAPSTTATAVSASSAVTISFSDAMDRADVEDRFAIMPAVDGDLSWDEGDLVFTPAARLEPGSRYTINLIGAHDAEGNVLGGKANFSFIVQDGAQVTRTEPETNAVDVDPAGVEVWFSGPMDEDATNAAFELRDTSTGALVGGNLTWNEASTQLAYVPDVPFPGGRTYALSFGGKAKDADGNAVDATVRFTTTAPAVEVAAPEPAAAAPAAPVPARGSTTTRVTVPAAAPATSLAGYALNQVNAARAAYGFPPLRLDAAISAAASAHAWDQARNNYFSHIGLDGSTRESRLRAAGVSFSYSGENQCYRIGMSEQGTLEWCHAQFMAEPYPGEWNHIANILDPRFTRMGVGVASVGGRVVITWNFAN